MKKEQIYKLIKNKIIGDNLVITSVDEALDLHEKFIQLRAELFYNQIIDIMPHYRGEQKYGWDIRSGIFRPPLNITDPAIAKVLEEKAVIEFEKVIHELAGSKIFRNIFNHTQYGKQWDLLFQAQHAGIKTTLTDWTAIILSALYFATEKSDDKEIVESDGQLWCWAVPNDFILAHNEHSQKSTLYDFNPYEINRTYLINPSSYLDDIKGRLYEYRMFKQKGRFVISPNAYCNIPLNEHSNIKDFLFRVKIPKLSKTTIRQELCEINITRETMYFEESPTWHEKILEINNKIYT